MATPVSSLQRPEQQPGRGSFASLFDRYKDTIVSKIPRQANADRLFNVARAAVLGNDKLMACEPMGVLLGINQIAQLGLEPNGPTGQAYLLPRWNNKAKRYEASVIISYKGFIDLALRSDSCIDIEAQVVYERDNFSFTRTSKGPQLVHEPCWEDDPGAMRLAYAVAWRPRGSDQVFPHFEVLPSREILNIKSRFMPTNRDGKPTGPWVTDEAEMWRKTAVRRLAKFLQLSPELSMAAAMDGARVVATVNDVDQALAGSTRLAFDDDDSEQTAAPAPTERPVESVPPKAAPAGSSNARPQAAPASAPAARTRETTPVTPAPAETKVTQPEPAQESPKPTLAAVQTTSRSEVPQTPAQSMQDPFEDLDMFLGGD